MNTLPTKGVGVNASRERPTTAADGDEVPLSAAAGDHAKGVFRCVDCGHAVTVHRELPPCPMCGGPVCADCGKPIPEGRLDARPEAARCVGCQSKWDRKH